MPWFGLACKGVAQYGVINRSNSGAAAGTSNESAFTLHGRYAEHTMCCRVNVPFYARCGTAAVAVFFILLAWPNPGDASLHAAPTCIHKV